MRMYERLQEGGHCPNGGLECQKDIDLGQLTLRYYLYVGEEDKYLRFLQRFVEALGERKGDRKVERYYNFYLSKLYE